MRQKKRRITEKEREENRDKKRRKGEEGRKGKEEERRGERRGDEKEEKKKETSGRKVDESRERDRDMSLATGLVTPFRSLGCGFFPGSSKARPMPFIPTPVGINGRAPTLPSASTRS